MLFGYSLVCLPRWPVMFPARSQQPTRPCGQERNHLISRRIVEAHPHSIIGLEDLTHIRERTRRRTHKRKKNGKGHEPVSSKQRKGNRHASQWAFAELHSSIAYKALLAGSMAVMRTVPTKDSLLCVGVASIPFMLTWLGRATLP